MKTENLKDFKILDKKADAIASAFSDVEDDIILNRELRKMRIDLEGMRKDERLKPDETYIPSRIIDNNIRRSKPRAIQYFKNSHRVNEVQVLEDEFSNHMKYTGWITPFIKIIDGSELHGWDSMELVFDVEKPGHLCFEQIGAENLIFDVDTINIQNQELLMRRHYMTKQELEYQVEHEDWNEEVVKDLISKERTQSNTSSAIRDQTYPLFKVWFKDPIENVVYVCWRIDSGSTWLYPPKKLYMGRNDKELPGVMLYEKDYPVFVLKYEELEDLALIETQGRGKLDEPIQEASSALLSVFINGHVRAHNVFGSPAQMPPEASAEGTAPRQTDMVIEHGKFYDRPVNFFTMPYPDDSSLRAIQMLSIKNSQDSAQTDFAVMNRKDTEKTAKEIQSAEEMASQLGSVQMTLISNFAEEIFSAAFNIWRNRVELQKIQLSNINILNLLVFNELDIQYKVIPAGDVDVIQRKEKQRVLMSLWGLIGPTPAGEEMLKDIIRNFLPEEAQRYVTAIEQNNAKNGLINDLLNVINSFTRDQNGELEDEYKPQANNLEALMARARNVMTSPS